MTTIIDKEIVKTKIRALHILSQEEVKLKDLTQVSDALHDIADVLDYLYEKVEEASP